MKASDDFLEFLMNMECQESGPGAECMGMLSIAYSKSNGDKTTSQIVVSVEFCLVHKNLISILDV